MLSYCVHPNVVRKAACPTGTHWIRVLPGLVVLGCIPSAQPKHSDPDLSITIAAVRVVAVEQGGRLKSVTFPKRPDLGSEIARALRVKAVAPGGSIENLQDRIRITLSVEGTHVAIVSLESTAERGRVELIINRQDRGREVWTATRVVELRRYRGRWMCFGVFDQRRQAGSGG